MILLLLWKIGDDIKKYKNEKENKKNKGERLKGHAKGRIGE